VCVGGLLQTDPQERAKTTTASSGCRPRPTDPGRGLRRRSFLLSLQRCPQRLTTCAARERCRGFEKDSRELRRRPRQHGPGSAAMR